MDRSDRSEVKKERSTEYLATLIRQFEELVQEATGLREKIRADQDARELLEHRRVDLELLIDNCRKHIELLLEEAKQKMYQSTGRKPKSLEAFKKAVELNSDLDKVTQKYDELKKNIGT